MNKKNYLGLLAILPLFTVAIIAGFANSAEAVGGLGIGEAKERLKVDESEPDVKLVLIQIGEPEPIGDETRKSYKGYNEEQFDTTDTFRTVYLIQNEGKDKVWNIEVLVKSDTETATTKLVGKLDPKHSSVTVFIKALDPESISAKILRYEA